jgi:hypothetical protein
LAAGDVPLARKFDEYGAIRWEDEKARLDNFAFQLQNMDTSIGYILVVDAVGGCQGEAQARANRAKRYVVEHRRIPWNRIIWKVEGYQSEISTSLVIAPREALLSWPLLSVISGTDGPMTRRCRIRLKQIASSRW